MLDLAAVILLATQCAPAVAAETIISIVDVESRFDPLAIGVNSGPRLPGRPTNADEAARVARRLIKAGGSVDLGIAQINSGNLGWLGLSIEDAFEPCANLKAAARILTENFRTAAKTEADPQEALRAALSLYNTGHPRRGVQNGYVARVESSARRLLPAIKTPSPTPAAADATVFAAPAHLVAGADQDVFRRAPSTALIFGRQVASDGNAFPAGDTQ